MASSRLDLKCMVYMLNSSDGTAKVPTRVRVAAPFEITEEALADLSALHSSMVDKELIDDSTNGGICYMNKLDAIIVCDVGISISGPRSNLLEDTLLPIIRGTQTVVESTEYLKESCARRTAADISAAELDRLTAIHRLSIFYRPALMPDDATDSVLCIYITSKMQHSTVRVVFAGFL